jgi:tripartite-type tricarboxylate transporter receptor subunit TctC
VRAIWAWLSESGLKGFEVMEWSGLAAPPTITKEVLDVVLTKFREAGADPALRDAVNKLGYITISETPEDFRNAIKKENAQWREVVKRANIQL